MSINFKLDAAVPRHWLGSGAVWAIALAWAGAGIYGWWFMADGVMRVITIVLSLSCQVLAVTMLARALEVDTWLLRVGCGLVAIGSVMFTGWSGHQALDVSSNRARADWAELQQAQGELNAAALAVEAIAPIPVNDEAGYRIGPQSRALLMQEREQRIARAEAAEARAQAKVDRLGDVARPSAEMPQWLSWAIVILIETIELFGLALVNGRRTAIRPVKQAPAPQPVPVDASEAARALVSMRRDRQRATA